MDSGQPTPAPAVEFFIEVCSDAAATQVAPGTSDEPRDCELRRNQRCWDFPNWRLHRAAAAPNNGGLKEMKQLHLGADVHCKDWKGRTALHEAAKAGNLAVARYLVSRGANVDAPDDNGSTPLVEAVRFHHQDLAAFLIAERRRIQIHQLLPAIDDSDSPRCWRIFLLQASMSNIAATMGRRDLFKWLLIVMNAGVELCQAVVSEEAGEGKIGGKLYRRLTLGFSFICLVLSVMEVAKEGTTKGAKWRKIRGRCYPTIQCPVFGRFTLWFGLIISTLQFTLNAVALGANRALLKFDYLALLLAVCLLLAPLIDDGDNETNKMDRDRNCLVPNYECEVGLGWLEPNITAHRRGYSNPLL